MSSTPKAMDTSDDNQQDNNNVLGDKLNEESPYAQTRQRSSRPQWKTLHCFQWILETCWTKVPTVWPSSSLFLLFCQKKKKETACWIFPRDTTISSKTLLIKSYSKTRQRSRSLLRKCFHKNRSSSSRVLFVSPNSDRSFLVSQSV